MKALVTGANGFLGSHLVDELMDDGGWDIRVLVRPFSDLRWLKRKPVEKFFGDLTDAPRKLYGAVRGMDVVFHVAGLTKALSKKRFREVNSTGTENLLKACSAAAKSSSRFVFVSSAGAQGPARNSSLCTEHDVPRPVTDYGRSKLAAESCVRQYKDRLDCRIVRPGGIYGPRDMEMLPAFRIIEKRVMMRLGIKERMVNMAYARDITRAVLAAARVSVDSGEVFLIGGHNASQQQLLDAVAVALGRKPVVQFAVPGPMVLFAAGVGSALAILSRRPQIFSLGNCSRLLASSWALDLTKARSKLNYTPEWDLESGMVQTCRWYRSEGLL